MEETLEAPRAKASRELQPGATLGKYRLERILGSGGMGVVWAAHDPDLDRAVALKVLRYDSPSTELRTRLLREAQAMARLKDPNVLTVYGVESEGDRDFIAMELVDGASLDAWLETKPLAHDVWAAILAAGRGLAAAHRVGLVHRDFKPHNVLRSRDGRVMVTDFGLARGHENLSQLALETTLPAAAGLEQTIEQTPSSTGGRVAHAVDSKLTQTGALLGTPAYMAPEQFAGASSGPRTDQFAFCVTAWQLLTGERPFRGDTLEQLRDATRSGTLHGKLPGAIRAVLVRGLAADPNKRWPDMESLLAALERAKRRPLRIAQIAGMVAIAGLAITLAFKVLGAPSKTASICPMSAADEMAKAWSPAMGRATREHVHDAEAAEYVVGELDHYAQQWIASYQKTCETPRTNTTFAKLGCLIGQRDYVASVTDLLPSLTEDIWIEAELAGVLPHVGACDVDSPVAPPTMPSDSKRRARVGELRAKVLIARFHDATKAIAELTPMLEEAKELGWEPLIAETHHSLAMANRQLGQHFAAREHYERANELARRSHQYQLEADTWDGLLEAELDATPEPRVEGRFERRLEDAWAAVRNAGGDPVHGANIMQDEAAYLLSRDRFDAAIDKFDASRTQAFDSRDAAQATRVALDEAVAMLRRNLPDDTQRAWDMLLETERRADASKLRQSKRRALAYAFWLVALMRGDAAAGYGRSDRFTKLYTVDGAVELRGRVVDVAGNPVAGATVVTWIGYLSGDTTRVYSNPQFPGAIATTDATGAFTIKGSRAAGIIAEHGELRSTPRVIGNDALTLTLQPTRVVAGTVESDDEALAGIVAAAHYELGPDLGWDLLVPVGRAHAFRFTKLPAGDATLRLADAIDPNRPNRKVEIGPLTDNIKARWDKGVSLDAIILDGKPTQELWLFRGKQSAKTIADLKALFTKLPFAISHPALEIGIGDQTQPGMEHYRLESRHARFFHTPPGDITVCMSEPVVCKQLVVGDKALAVPF